MSNSTRNDRAATKATVAHEQQTPMRHLLLDDRTEIRSITKAVNNSYVLGEHETVLKVTTTKHLQHDCLVHLNQLAIRSALRKLPDPWSLQAATKCPPPPRNVDERLQRFGSYQPLAVVQIWKVGLSHGFSHA